MPKTTERPSLQEHFSENLPKLQSVHYDENAPYPPSRIDMVTAEITEILTRNGQSENINPTQLAETMLYIHQRDPENDHLISDFANHTDIEATLASLNQYHESNKEPIATFDKGNEDFRTLKKRFTEARQVQAAAAPEPSQPEQEQPH